MIITPNTTTTTIIITTTTIIIINTEWLVPCKKKKKEEDLYDIEEKNMDDIEGGVFHLDDIEGGEEGVLQVTWHCWNIWVRLAQTW